MLLGNDVFDVVTEVTVLLPGKTVFATVACSPADQIPDSGVGHCWVLEVSLRSALSLRIAMKSAALMSAS